MDRLGGLCVDRMTAAEVPAAGLQQIDRPAAALGGSVEGGRESSSPRRIQFVTCASSDWFLAKTQS